MDANVIYFYREFSNPQDVKERGYGLQLMLQDYGKSFKYFHFLFLPGFKKSRPKVLMDPNSTTSIDSF